MEQGLLVGEVPAAGEVSADLDREVGGNKEHEQALVREVSVFVPTVGPSHRIKSEHPAIT